VKAKLSLAERTFRCESCGHQEDRDVNAARNLLYLAASGVERVNACGGTIRPRSARQAPVQSGGVEEDLFDFRELLIRQPARLIPGQARYEIFDTQRHLLAVASEAEGRSRMQALTRQLPGSRSLAVRTAAGGPIMALVKRDADWVADITDPDGKPVGQIRIGGTRRHYTLLDGNGEMVGEAAGDLAVKNFAVTGAEGARIASVRKTWAGLRKELLTSADHYKVTFADPAPRQARVLTVMMTIVLDLAAHGPD